MVPAGCLRLSSIAPGYLEFGDIRAPSGSDARRLSDTKYTIPRLVPSGLFAFDAASVWMVHVLGVVV